MKFIKANDVWIDVAQIVFIAPSDTEEGFWEIVFQNKKHMLLVGEDTRDAILKALNEYCRVEDFSND